MKLTAYVASQDHVCCRYRLAALSPFLIAAGHSVDFFNAPWWWERLLVSGPRHRDACILQRHLPSALELHRIRRSCESIIFDLDDAVWLRDSYSDKGMLSSKRLRRFQRVISMSDRVVVGNRFLAQKAAEYTQTQRIHVVPTCVDPHKYPLAAHTNDGPIELVWIGSSSTLTGLEYIRPTLESIGLAIPRARLKIVCDRFISLDLLPVIQSPWTEAGEASELAAADVGIAWMPDDDWSRGKCGLKILQYMAAGLPVIANPIGVHSEMVQHGVTGFLVDSVGEWIEAVRTLAGDPGLRRTMGLAGRKSVEADYSIGRAGQQWLQLLDGLQTARMAA